MSLGDKKEVIGNAMTSKNDDDGSRKATFLLCVVSVRFYVVTAVVESLRKNKN